MTAFVLGASKEHTRKFSTLLDTSFIIQNILFGDYENWSEFEKENYQNNRPMETFSPDGYTDFNESTGTINFYPAGLSKRLEDETIDGLKKFFDKNEFEVEWPPKKEKSGAFDGDVYRLNVTKNPEDDRDVDEAPEVNFSNTNMEAILRTIGLVEMAEDYGGEIGVDELMLRIRNASGVKQARLPYHSDMEKFRNPEAKQKGATVIDPGLSDTDIDERLSKLFNLAKWAKKNGYEKISIG